MSGLRSLGPGFDPGIVAALDARLRSVAESENAAVLLAVESARDPKSSMAPGHSPRRRL
ncbi:MAG TPA: hypothetical protein VGN55_24520 [Xanthobacteraceae bacterium]